MDSENEIDNSQLRGQEPDLGLLIELVQQFEHLYNLSHKSYKYTKRKEESWKEISDIIPMPVETCKKHWKNLRDRFMRERREKPSGARAEELQWLLYNEMLWCAKYCRPRKTTSATPSATPQIVQPGPSSAQSSVSVWSSTDSIMSPPGVFEEVEEIPEEVAQDWADDDLDASSAKKMKPTPSKKNLKNKDCDIGDVVRTANRITDNMTQPPVRLTQNETFCKYVLSRLDLMSEDEATAKRKRMLIALEDM